MITIPYFRHLTTFLIVLIVANTGISRELIKIFEAKHGQPVAPQYLPEGSEEKIWDSTPNRAFLDDNGRIYLPAGNKIRVLSRDGVYIKDRILQTDIDATCLQLKKLTGIDHEGRAWFYIPFYETSQTFDGDYRHSLIAIDSIGKIAQSVKLTVPFSQKNPYLCQILKNGLFFLRGIEGCYLIDISNGAVTSTDCEAYDYFGNGYKGSHVWNDALGMNVSALRKYPHRSLKSGSGTDGIKAISMDDFLKTIGAGAFFLFSGTNKSGHIAYSMVTRPNNTVNFTYYEYVIYDGETDRIVDHNKVNWDLPPERAPRVLFSRLEDDDSILIGIESPDVPWRITSDGTGMMGIKVEPGPSQLTFQIFRLQ